MYIDPNTGSLVVRGVQVSDFNNVASFRCEASNRAGNTSAWTSVDISIVARDNGQ